MSLPRQILAGTTYLLTRRALLRTLLFRPDAAINQIVLYALAVSSQRYGMEVHAFCAMSNHLHLVVTDVLGVLPDFLAHFHRIVALSTKVLRKWEGPVWDHEHTSAVQLLTRQAMVEEIAYVLANPVAAGLVRRAHEWPGAKVDVHELGRGVLRAARPGGYFDPENPLWPEEAALQLTLPPAIPQEDAEGFCRDVAAELEGLETAAHRDVEGRGLRFLGQRQVREVSPYDRATSFEPLRARNPTVAVGGAPGEAWWAAAAAVRAFRTAYRSALKEWRGGERVAVFPTGTWWMRVFHAACVPLAMPAV
jgi:putative transposase